MKEKQRFGGRGQGWKVTVYVSCLLFRDRCRSLDVPRANFGDDGGVFSKLSPFHKKMVT